MIFEGTKVIAVGVNYIGIHAEISALDKCARIEDKKRIRWSKTSILVARVKVEDHVYVFGMSKPCVHCAESLKASKLSKVFWTTENGDIDGCRVCDLVTCHLCRRKRIELEVYTKL